MVPLFDAAGLAHRGYLGVHRDCLVANRGWLGAYRGCLVGNRRIPQGLFGTTQGMFGSPQELVGSPQGLCASSQGPRICSSVSLDPNHLFRFQPTGAVWESTGTVW